MPVDGRLTPMQLTGTGIWSTTMRFGDAAAAAAAATELEELGYTVVGSLTSAATCSRRSVCCSRRRSRWSPATGVLNLWMHTAEETAEGSRRARPSSTAHASWSASASATGRWSTASSNGTGPTNGRWPARARSSTGSTRRRPRWPLATGSSRRSARRCSSWPGTAAAAPTRTSSRRSTPPWPARSSAPTLLAGREQGVVLDDDPATARDTGRHALAHLSRSAQLPEQPVPARPHRGRHSTNGGSDRLVDALIAWGDEAAIAARSPPTATPAPITSASRSSEPRAATCRSPSGGRSRRP